MTKWGEGGSRLGSGKLCRGEKALGNMLNYESVVFA